MHSQKPYIYFTLLNYMVNTQFISKVRTMYFFKSAVQFYKGSIYFFIQCFLPVTLYKSIQLHWNKPPQHMIKDTCSYMKDSLILQI